MRGFSYYRPEEDDSQEIEGIIRHRRRKIARQQAIYTVILLFIISIICVWAYRKTVYAEFDGYVSLDERIFRIGEDIYFLQSNVRIGDLVVPGDTIFSYAIAHNFLSHTHNDYEPAVVARNRDLRLQYGMARQDLEVLRVRVAELERQLSTEDHNIRFGLSSNRNKLRTEQELAEAREQYKALRRKIGVLWSGVSQTNKSLLRLDNNGYGHVSIADRFNFDLLRRLDLVDYVISVDSSIITKKFVPSNSLVLRGEQIMSLQSLNGRNNNLAIVAYVLPKQMKYVNYHSRAEIIVNNEISYTGRVMMLGARTEEIPGELRNTLSRDHTASIVVFDIDPHQDIPYWSLTDGVPVRIRINKLKNRKPIVGDYIIYNTTTGVYPETLMHARHECSEHPDSVYMADGTWQARDHDHEHEHDAALQNAPATANAHPHEAASAPAEHTDISNIPNETRRPAAPVAPGVSGVARPVSAEVSISPIPFPSASEKPAAGARNTTAPIATTSAVRPPASDTNAAPADAKPAAVDATSGSNPTSVSAAGASTPSPEPAAPAATSAAAPAGRPASAAASASARPQIASDLAGTYHIIVASGADADGARREVAALKRRGYLHARVLSSEDRRLFRVSVAAFDTSAEANRALAKLKTQAEFGAAWILHAKK